MRHTSPPTRAAVAALVLVMAASVADAALAPGNAPARPRPGAELSSAYERMLRDQFSQGATLSRAVVTRWGLDVRDEAEHAPEHDAPAAVRPFGSARAQTTYLGADHRTNDPSGDASCTACAGRPLGQAETTIAALGDLMVAGWNDGKGFCPPNGAVQGYATSTDAGVTWVDRGDVPALGTGGRYRGDPVHFVDASNGTFWILGLYEGGTPGSGLALLNGHFSSGAWVEDGNRQIAVGGADFLDKEWGTVDPVSHHLYVTYSRFLAGTTSRIEFIRSTDGGTTWSAPTLMHDVSQDGNVQGSRPVVGPDGEVYVCWYEYGYPLSRHHVRKSVDGGVSWGPDVVAASFYENGLSGGPGFRRGFSPTFASIAVDRSNGPHRGRVYLAWDEALDFYDAPAPSLGNRSESEQNGNFANATSFNVGQVLRGSLTSSTDSLDLWRFSGTQGQTLYFRCDSATSGATFQLRLQSDCDTTLFQTMKFVAFNQSNFPAVAYTLPHTGTYYLRMFRSATGTANYRLLTSWDTFTPGQRASDHRDQFAAWSDGGATWSTPVRISNSAVGADGIFPEIAVDAAGRVFAYWHDWRDDAACGASSGEYLVASAMGGTAWGPNRRISDELSYWSINACGSANQGDYQGITTDGQAVIPCWADARTGDVDTYMERIVFDTNPGCPAPLAVAAGGATQPLAFTVQNAGNVDAQVAWEFEDTNGWLVSASPGTSGVAGLAPGSTLNASGTFQLPANCLPASTTVRFLSWNLDLWAAPAQPEGRDTCTVTLQCGSLSVPDGGLPLELAAPRPNPVAGRTQLQFTLPSPARVRLAIYAADGRRVRALHEGEAAAGLHLVLWDGRDDRGHSLAPGRYWVKLEAGGESRSRALTLLR
ncbi:MAG: FlgD immunoglobulin-like domain containing protein [Candidatus Eisenbacteria bacterium]